MKKYTMVIDGHNFMFKTLCVLPMNKGGLWLDKKKEREMFKSKLVQNLSASVRDFSDVIDNVVFVTDSTSWRKSLDDGVDYKGNRHTEDKINWDGFRECLDSFISELGKMGVIVSKAALSEADDLIFYWANRLTFEGTPVIINSSDKDMLQLIRFNEQTSCESLLYSTTTKKLYAPEGFSKMLIKKTQTLEDMFNTNGSMSIFERYDTLGSLVKKKKFEVEEVNADEALFTKLLIGDKSDNIPSVYTVTKNGRTFGITELKAGLIIKMFAEKTGVPTNTEYLYIDSALETLCDCIREVMKTDADNDTLIRNIKRNRTLVVLSNKSIPEEVIGNMMENVDSLPYKKNVVNFQYILKSGTQPVVKMTIGAVEKSDDTDFSFIKDRQKLF